MEMLIPPQVFSGPMSESVPSSITGFAHRRLRADSIASFTYFQDGQESPDRTESEEAVLDQDDEEFNATMQSVDDVESVFTPPKRRKSSGYSKMSVEDPLLSRRDSTRTDISGFRQGGRTSQKIYVVTEDLTIVVAGFTTRSIGFVLYVILSTLTLGLGYLILRWIPRLRVRLIGSAVPLRECSWVVIEVRFIYFFAKATAKVSSEPVG